MQRYAEMPFAPRKWPFFYGWVILAAGILGTLASIPGQTMGVSVFTDYLIEALGLSREGLSVAYMAGTIVSSFFLPLGGRWIDRYGARVTMVIASVAMGASLLLLGASDSIVRGVVASAGGGAIGAAAFISFFSFLCIRFFGQGLLSMIPRVMLGKWFHRRRGLAAGISGLFVTCGFSTSPLLLDEVIRAVGWRGACFLLAAVVGVGMGLVAFVFYRDNPEQCGLQPDGAHGDATTGSTLRPLRDFTVTEARRDYAFWVFSLGLAAQGLIVTAVTFHIVALGNESGIAREKVFLIFAPMPLFSVSASFLGGWLSDRVPLNRLLLVMMAMQGLGTGALLWFHTAWGFWLIVIGFGVSGGLFGCLVTVTWPRFYGLQHLGAISGLNMSIMVFASAIGPYVFARAEAMTGSFRAATMACLAMPLAIFLAALWAHNPQDKASARAS